MTPIDTHHHGLVSDGLHPVIYKALAGLALWLVVSAWLFFGGPGYVTFLLAVVTGFFLMAAAIPFLLWRTWRKNAPQDAAGNPVSAEADDSNPAFSEWWWGEFDTWHGRVEGWDAAVEVLLPLGAAAVGMTVIGLVFHIIAAGAS
ncbi:MAG TPA: hypothetical protein VGH49_05410 [Xanthobacteraceae bacterium]